jgi:hypothetical protein
MLVQNCEHDVIAQHPAELTPQIATPQLSPLAQHRAIALEVVTIMSYIDRTAGVHEQQAG